MRDHDVQRGESGFVRIALGEESLADLGQEVAGLGVIAEAGGDTAFDPLQREAVQRAAVGGRELGLDGLVKCHAERQQSRVGWR